ncbi:hypothetical protein [Chryseobacterium salivictor]|uniref:Uncharacterized protein n=1 Tax=Chryseobacterium salivictor TaxID=2547600 RepID=A0A4V1AL34_9FLAO|nr:hypothetical protein [Chryseobacterium salivictor]QBO58374.1 hypothetical protein NBC122_01559 [Chryseobacterium salivictor]
MAKVDINGNWHGKLGDYVYYVRNGKQMRRSLPTPHKGPKTEGMKKNALYATEFGTAALTSKHLRKALEQEFGNLGERYLSQQVNALLFQIKNCDPAPVGSRTPVGGLETAEGKALFNRFIFHQHRRKFPKILNAVLRGVEIEVVMNPCRTEASLTELQINLITGDFRRHDYRLTPADQKKPVVIKKKFRAKKGYSFFVFIAGKDSLQGVVLEKAEESPEKQAAEESL